MKVLLISLLILSFLGISVLTFTTMYHQDSGNKNCVTEMAAGLNCPANPFAFADFHLNLLRGLSSTYFSDFLNVYLALITFLLFGFIIRIFGQDSSDINRAKYYQVGYLFKSFTPLVEVKTSHWLSLHENSPAIQ